MGKTMRRFLGFTFGTAVAWAFAVKPRIWDKPDMYEIRRYDYARKGLFDPAEDIPENSLAAFRKAVDHGYGVTMDVRRTRDGVPVIFHDEHLYRMTEQDGRVELRTLEELKELRLSRSDETIPTLEQALNLINGQIPVLIELKTDGENVQALCDAVCEVLDEYEGVETNDSASVQYQERYRSQ